MPLTSLLVVFFAAQAFADTPPAPKMFKGMQEQRGQYQIVLPDHSGTSRSLIVCADNVMNSQVKRADPGCTYKLLKDTADEAVFETMCNGSASTVSMKRESAKSVLVTVRSEGAQGPQTMKIRYTHLGACPEGQATVTPGAKRAPMPRRDVPYRRDPSPAENAPSSSQDVPSTKDYSPTFR